MAKDKKPNEPEAQPEAAAEEAQGKKVYLFREGIKQVRLNEFAEKVEHKVFETKNADGAIERTKRMISANENVGSKLYRSTAGVFLVDEADAPLLKRHPHNLVAISPEKARELVGASE